MARCHCEGEFCKHHKLGEPCPNEAIAPFAHVPDPTRQNLPTPGSETGLCQTCWDNQDKELERLEMAQ
jgi:hypothetical protein